MRSLLTVLVLACVVAIASAQFPRGWINLFEPPFSQCPTIMTAISCVSNDLCYIPGGSNGNGFTVYKFDGAINGNFVPLRETTMEMMSMACSIGGTAAAAHGAIGGFGIGNGVEYMVNKTTFAPSQAPLFIVTQDIRASKKTGLDVLVVDQAGSNAVLYSGDGAKTFTQFPITSPMPLNSTFARYAAIPNTQSWYITLGDWPSNNNNKDGAFAHLLRDGEKVVKHLSQRVAFVKGPKGIRRVSRNMFTESKKAQAGKGDNQYSAAIATTKDGGKTWATVVSLATNFYFNGVDCATETYCIAVGEGFNDDAAGHIWLSTDGVNFKEVAKFPQNATGQYSLMAVKFLNEQEVWVGGSFMGQASSTGVFLYSIDGGNTWTQHGDIGYIGDVMDISFTNDGAGFAAAVTVYDDSTILRYDSKGPTPTPAPTWKGNFTQIQCTDGNCQINCTKFSFAQNVCLPLNGGGSSTAQCQPGVLMQTVYPLSNTCTGPSMQQPQPIDQCLQAENGSFENLCGPTMEDVKPAPANVHMRVVRRH